MGVAVALLLSACAVGPEYDTPDLALPGHWGAAAKRAEPAPQLKAWWRRMGDPMLDALMAEAVAGNVWSSDPFLAFARPGCHPTRAVAAVAVTCSRSDDISSGRRP